LIPEISLKTCFLYSAFLLCLMALNGCVVVAAADAVATTTVKVGTAVVGTAVDVTAAGVSTAAKAVSK
jgi:hypothetical protein